MKNYKSPNPKNEFTPELVLDYETDGELGFKIHLNLKSKELESPIVPDFFLDNPQKERFAKIEKASKKMLQGIGLDLSNVNISQTPTRIARMWLQIFKGLDYRNFPKISTFPAETNGFVRWNNITINTYCEHHFQSINGTCRIAYIPREKIFGLSKANRIADFFSSRPCTQERLTSQIHETLCYLLKNRDVAVQITAGHGCISCRGIKDAGSNVTTTSISGAFKEDPSTRSEFLTI